MRLACKLVKLGSHPTNNEKFERPIYHFYNKLYQERSVFFPTTRFISKKIISNKLDNGRQAMTQRASNF